MEEAHSPCDTNFSIFLTEGGKQTAAAELKKAHLPCSRAWNWARSWETWDLRKITHTEELSILTGFH